MNSTTHQHDTALVFLTNKTDRRVMDRLHGICSQARDSATCHVLLDQSTPDIQGVWESYCREKHLEGLTIAAFNIVDVARELAVKLFAPGRLVPGSAHLPLLWLSSKLTHKFYWFVEDDVVYTGNWSDFIRQFEGDSSDLLCSHLTSYREDPNWSWWSTFNAPATALRGFDKATLISRGLFPIYRISARALLKVLDCQRAGWSGHMEVLVPTALKHAGQAVADLNRVSPSPVYADGALRQGEGSGKLSSLRFRPPVSKEEIQSTVGAVIFHPVKFDADEVPETVTPARRISPYLKGRSVGLVKGREIRLLGSAPSFHGSLEMKEHEVLVCVNGAALALKDAIVPRITFMNTSISGARGAGLETYRSLDRLKTDHLIIIEGSPNLSERWISMLERVSCNSFDFYSLEMRMEFMKQFLGTLKGIQGDHVPSTGVFAALALLAQGAKSIRLNGFSLVDGHSYLSGTFRRDHVEIDRSVFEMVRKMGWPVKGTIETETGEILL